VAQEEYKEELLTGRLEINDIIADNFLQQILLNPEKFDVVALTNLNGDYASDALAAQVGAAFPLEPTLTIKQAMLFLKQHMEQLRISQIKIRLILAQFYYLAACF